MGANQTTKPTLGVVAICKNEERDLPFFLQNLLAWVDEIVIVDDGSEDNTLAILEDAGPKLRIIQDPRHEGEYFSHQRNKGINAATSDWLLHMDIDERVTPEFAAEILTAIQDESKDGYRLRRLNYFLHRPMKGSGMQYWNLVHLARREKFRFGGKSHETCLLDAPPERVGQLNNYMVHLNDTSYLQRMKKSFRYSQEEAENIIESGRRVRWYDLILRPLRTLIVKYVLHKAHRDGMAGLIFTLHSMGAVFRAHALAWDQQNPIERRDLELELSEQWQQNPLEPAETP